MGMNRITKAAVAALIAMTCSRERFVVSGVVLNAPATSPKAGLPTWVLPKLMFTTWLEMEIGIGILLFVAGAALATTHRTQ